MVTRPRVFKEPTPLETALAFLADVRKRPHCLRVDPGERHWEVFTRLCRETRVRGNLRWRRPLR